MTIEKPELKSRIGAAIAARQLEYRLSDAEVARQLSLDGESVVSLIKRGVLLTSHGLANDLHHLLESTLPEVMNLVFNDHGQDITDHFIPNIERTYISCDEQEIVWAYRSVQGGGRDTKRIKVAKATVFLVPDEPEDALTTG